MIFPFPQRANDSSASTNRLQLWTQARANFTGRHHHLHNAPFEPKPVQQPHPPILVGAGGGKVALGIVARHADMWNRFGTPETLRHKIEVLAEHCSHMGRNPDEIEKSVLISATLSSDDHTKKLIDDYLAVGVTHIVFSVSPSTEPSLLRRFAQEIMTAFR